MCKETCDNRTGFTFNNEDTHLAVFWDSFRPKISKHGTFRHTRMFHEYSKIIQKFQRFSFDRTRFREPSGSMFMTSECK